MRALLDAGQHERQLRRFKERYCVDPVRGNLRAGDAEVRMASTFLCDVQ